MYVVSCLCRVCCMLYVVYIYVTVLINVPNLFEREWH